MSNDFVSAFKAARFQAMENWKTKKMFAEVANECQHPIILRCAYTTKVDESKKVRLVPRAFQDAD